MTSRDLKVDEIMAILPQTAGRLAALTHGLGEKQLRTPPELDAWSVNDVLAHLRACSDVLGGNMLRIVAESHPAWKGMNPRTWQKKSGYHEWKFAPAFAAFTRQRAELLAILQPLAHEAWERTAIVSVPPNKTYEYSVRYYGDWLARHERAHLKKLSRIIDAVVNHKEA